MRVWRYCLCGRRWAALVGTLVASSLVGGFSQAAEEHGVEHVRAQLRQQAGQPQAIARIAELLERQELTPPRLTLQILRELVDGTDSERVDPLVLAQAAYRLSLQEDDQGALAEAEVHRKGLGLVHDGWVLGPFDAQGRGAIDRASPVEASLSKMDPRVAKPFPGKERDVSWRRVPGEAFVRGALYLDAMLRPDREAMAYLAVYVTSDRDRWVALRMGSPGPVKAWLGGGLVFSSDAVRAPAMDQDAAPIHLRSGQNLLVVKTVITHGQWRLFLRLTEPDGRPLAGVSTSAEVPEHLAAAGRHSSARPVRDLTKLLRQRADGHGARDAAQAWLDYARYLALVAPQDVNLRAAEQATKRSVAVSAGKLHRPAVQALLLLGDVAREEDDRRAAIERALPGLADPTERALALAAIGRIWHQQRRDQEAVARWREALSVDPSCIPAQLALARQEEQAGLKLAARQRLESLPAVARNLPLVQGALGDVLLGLDQRAEAEGLYRAAYQVLRSDASALRSVAALVRSRGGLDEAARLYAEGVRWRPDLTSLVLDQSAVLEGQGEVGAARALLRKAMERLPDDAGLSEELGRLEARAGRTREAVSSMRRSIELRPQNPNLRRYAEALSAESKKTRDSRTIDELASANAGDSEAMAKQALLASARDGDVAPAEVVLDRTVVRVHSNGLSERFVQRLVHFRTDRAANDGGQLWIRYEPGRQEVEVRKARVWRMGKNRGLEVSEATGRDERDLSEPWYGLFYDSRAEIVLFENLRAGDVIEIQYSVADVAYRNELADYFGDFEMIADTYPTRRWDYTLLAPKQRVFYFNQPKLSGVSYDSHARGEEVVYRFAAEHVARVESEPAMPGVAEVAPYLHVSTYRSWEDVGRWYWNLIADQMQDDGTLTKAALAAIVGLVTPLDRVKAIHRLVLERTRYVGLEFGIHGYLPYKATQVFERGFGDCKDKATLLITLLRSVGIDAEIVLLRTRRGGTIVDKPASLAVFDHAIAYVPSLDLYLDGTAEFSGLAELPSEDQDAMALRVSARGAKLVRTPLLPAADNRARRTWNVDLNSDGSARIAEDLTITGQAAPEWREHYQAGGEQRERYAKVWSGRYAGSVLDRVDMSLSDRNRPVAVHALVRVPQLGQRRAPNQIDLPLSSREADFTSTYARLGRRQWPLVLGYPWRHEEQVTYQLPDGSRIVRAPASREIESRFGRFIITMDEHAGGGKVAVKTALVVDKNRIEPSEYPAFRAFLRDTDALLADRLIVEVKGGR